MPAAIALPVIAVDLVEGLRQLGPGAFQLDLHQRQPVDQDGDVIAVYPLPYLRDLLRHLEPVVAPVGAVQEMDVAGGAVIALQVEAPGEAAARALEHIAAIQMRQDAGEFGVGEAGVVLQGKLAAQVRQHRGFIGKGDALIPLIHQLRDQIGLKFGFGLGHGLSSGGSGRSGGGVRRHKTIASGFLAIGR